MPKSENWCGHRLHDTPPEDRDKTIPLLPGLRSHGDQDPFIELDEHEEGEENR